MSLSTNHPIPCELTLCVRGLAACSTYEQIVALGAAYPSHASKDRSPKVRTAALRAVLAIRWLCLYARHHTRLELFDAHSIYTLSLYTSLTH